MPVGINYHSCEQQGGAYLKFETKSLKISYFLHRTDLREGGACISRINKRRVGAEYEQIAVEYMISKGYRIVERNYRTSYGEIDIILEKDSALIFCETKFRSSSLCGDPLEAVDRRKQKRISRVALFYYATHGYFEGVPCRFDVIGIYGDGTICHIENAFEFQ